jgi:transcriptional regulator with XRE-family HTH domain
VNAAELLVKARTDAGLTQAELAARVGTTQSSIARTESGRTSPTVERLDLLVRACGATLAIEIDRSSVPDLSIVAANRRLSPQQRWDKAIVHANFALDLRSAMRATRRP